MQSSDTSWCLVTVAYLVLLLVPGAVALLAALATGGAPVPDGAQRLRAVARTTTRWRWAGVAAGLLAVLVVPRFGSLGRGAMLAGPVFALCVLVGVVVGELRVPAADGEVRSAALETRRVRDYLPRVLSACVAALVVLGALLLTLTTFAGSPDDLGRPGRALAYRCSDTVSGAVGPWPGSYYSGPLAVVVLGGLVATVVALRRIVLRPRQGEDVAVDEALRRHAARSVVAATGLLAAVPLVGVCVVTSTALASTLHGRGGCPTPADGVLAGPTLVATLVLLVAAVVLGGFCVAALVRPVSVAGRSRSRVPAGGAG